MVIGLDKQYIRFYFWYLKVESKVVQYRSAQWLYECTGNDPRSEFLSNLISCLQMWFDSVTKIDSFSLLMIWFILLASKDPKFPLCQHFTETISAVAFLILFEDYIEELEIRELLLHL